MTANQATLFGLVFVVLTSTSFYVGLTIEAFHWVLVLTPVFSSCGWP